ncbi:hypothetical protein ACJ72_08102 [Emergomyces africanus]|uniref:Uncharacterized protein n=1 Tax=Emergomyces africanus TaxID=1955775 RepID=A0A1B7NLU1_9EURO|nr:hypothetical protein ACJ72_08102 [Emergomyces africanus]
MANQILQKHAFKSVMLHPGKPVTLSVATQTTNWTRPTISAQTIFPSLEKAVAKSPELVPSWADDVCAR